MLVEIRIYRRHDADLIMLKSYGVNISKMMRLALENYVRGERIKFRLPNSHSCDITDCSMLRYRLNVKNPDVIRLLKSVKRGYRNQFCKALLRDMLDAESLGVFLATDEAIEFEDNRLETESLVAGDELGLISKRDQITTETFFVARQKADDDEIKTTVKKVERDAERAKKEDEKFVDNFFTEKTSSVRSGNSAVYGRKKKERFSWDDETTTTSNQKQKRNSQSDSEDDLSFLNAMSFSEMVKEEKANRQAKIDEKKAKKDIPSHTNIDDEFDDFEEGFANMFDDEPSEATKIQREEERNRNLSSMFADLLNDGE